MDGPNLIVPQQQQVNRYSNHNTNYLHQDDFEQTNLEQQTNENNDAQPSEQYDRLIISRPSIVEGSQHLTCDTNSETAKTDTFEPFSDADQFSSPGNCDIVDQNITDEDAFIDAICADPTSVFNNTDSSKKYHINKLYQPLTNDTSGAKCSRQHQQMDQDEEYLLHYQELSNGSVEKTDLSRILDDDIDNIDDCDAVDHHLRAVDGQAGGVDSLDCLNLDSMMESFDDFGAQSLIGSSNGERDPLMSEASNIKPDSSGRLSDQGEYTTDGHINTNNEYTHEISSSGHGLSPDNHQQHQFMNTNHLHQYRNMFSHHDFADNCYNVLNSGDQINHFEFDQPDEPSRRISVPSDETSISTCRQNYTTQATEPHEAASHQDITSEIDSCIQTLSDPQPTDPYSGLDSTSLQEVTSLGTSPSKRKQCSTDTSEDVKSQRGGTRKLKKRRSTPATKKSQQLLSANKARDDEQRENQNKQAERIQELTNSLLNDDEEFLISDNNSIRSDGCKQSPVVNHYRRRTANARERIRMREINQAFEKLKTVVPAELIRQAIQESEEASDQGSSRRKSSPSSKSCSDQQSDSMKLTKITTLRLAVSYIAKLTDILNQSQDNPPEKLVPKSVDSQESLGKPAKVVSSQTTEEKSSKIKRRSRATTRKAVKQNLDEIRVKNNESTPEKLTSDQVFEKTGSANHTNQQSKVLDQSAAVAQQQPIPIATNSIATDLYQQQRSNQQQQIQTTFISLPNQQRPKYLATFPNQQQMLITQQLANGGERQLVTPVAVAILGIPTNNNQSANSVNSRGIQFLGIQKPQQQHAMPIIQQQQQQQLQQQPTYNFQLSQAQAQNHRQSQQVTLTLNDLNGLSFLRLSNPQSQTQRSVPIQIRTTNSEFIANQQQTQIFTASNGLNYAFCPLTSSHQQSTKTNLITTMGEAITTTPTNFQQATLHICTNNTNNHNNSININNNSNLFSQSNISNISMGNNNIIRTTSDSNSPSNTSGQQQQSMNGQTLCNINHSGLMSDQTAIISTGINSDHQSDTGGSTISFTNLGGCNQQGLDGKKIQLSQQNQQQQQNDTLFVPRSNIMAISTAGSNNQSFQSQSIQMVHQSTLLEHNQPKKASVVYINPMRLTNSQQQPQQVCLANSGSQESQQQMQQMQLQISNQEKVHSNGQQQQKQQTVIADKAPSEALTKAATQNKMEYVTHFGVQAPRNQGKNAPTETNITKLVASLATSIQPQTTQAKTTQVVSKSKASGDSRKAHQQLQHQQHQQQQQQQPVRTYRFHNYDGDMINNHLYGANNSDRHQAGNQQKRGQTMRQLHDSMHKMTDQQPAAACHRSRQNSLSSICSTTSCSSSSPNSTSSISGSPANHSFVVLKSPKSSTDINS